MNEYFVSQDHLRKNQVEFFFLNSFRRLVLISNTKITPQNSIG